MNSGDRPQDPEAIKGGAGNENEGRLDGASSSHKKLKNSLTHIMQNAFKKSLRYTL